METLIELISDNIVIVIIIIGGLVSFFNRNKSAKEEQKGNRPYKGQSNGPKPSGTPSGGNYQTNRNRTAEKPSHSPVQTMAIEEQQNEQMKKLAGRIQTRNTTPMPNETRGSHKANIGHVADNSKPVKPLHQENFKREIAGQLTRKGLIDSVIMAEVLGRPRATKPYRSIIAERRR